MNNIHPGVPAPEGANTYRHRFDHLGRPRGTPTPTLKRHYLLALIRWLSVAAALAGWAALTAWMDA